MIFTIKVKNKHKQIENEDRNSILSQKTLRTQTQIKQFPLRVSSTVINYFVSI